MLSYYSPCFDQARGEAIDCQSYQHDIEYPPWDTIVNGDDLAAATLDRANGDINEGSARD